MGRLRRKTLPLLHLPELLWNRVVFHEELPLQADESAEFTRASSEAAKLSI
jgi:hypothetical protein